MEGNEIRNSGISANGVDDKQPGTAGLKMTYANTIANSSLPKKDQAIIIDSVEGYTLEDYIDGLEELIQVRDIRGISKVTGNRVCVYLADKDLVTQLKNKVITVGEHALSIKSLVILALNVSLFRMCI
ncbi:hypothetical protein QAD02_004223 [Eretmocerus hayati]|uniref:Uncharacterized protein n=1 Tax=Eretmocerus hayati TaxID=131215 RepID=A0ACC2NPD7_9HYME|nr:hypothetical protein QAD02_004223 [Eretmocerus hayati]